MLSEFFGFLRSKFDTASYLNLLPKGNNGHTDSFFSYLFSFSSTGVIIFNQLSKIRQQLIEVLYILLKVPIYHSPSISLLPLLFKLSERLKSLDLPHQLLATDSSFQRLLESLFHGHVASPSRTEISQSQKVNFSQTTYWLHL